jgi:tritrans,polycis-undecaprenyl-diphosphate synthase [geranylgeranyl-diphosphate specific]
MGNVPNHVGIIVDGNRRFAKKLMLEPWKGHEYGAKKFEKLLDWCKEIGIRKLTLFVFSIENFNRPKKEFNYLMDVFRDSYDKLMKDPRVDEYRLRINFVGRLNLFPKDIQEKAEALMKKTKDYSEYTLTFAFGYGGRSEIVDATKKMIKDGLKPEEVDENSFAEYLYMRDDVDLIIRTSGEKRTSGFLLWQGSYAELLFVDKFWPEFEKQDLLDAIADYASRQRRFGK